MKILTIGDIVGKCGLQKLKEELPRIVKENEIDFVIVNGENAADGMGLLEKQYREILALGVDVVTMGNHTWAKKDIFNFIEDERIVRPANYSKNNPGKGYRILECKKNGKKVAVINLIGRVTMGVLSDNPFTKSKEIIADIKNSVDIIVVDFHAEATAEKIALYNYLDGEANIIFGTHTHVQTADEQIINNMTYITDAGFCGATDSVIGMEYATSLRRMTTLLPERYEVAVNPPCTINAVEVSIVDETVTAIKRINVNVDMKDKELEVSVETKNSV